MTQTVYYLITHTYTILSAWVRPRREVLNTLGSAQRYRPSCRRIGGLNRDNADLNQYLCNARSARITPPISMFSFGLKSVRLCSGHAYTTLRKSNVNWSSFYGEASVLVHGTRALSEEPHSTILRKLSPQIIICGILWGMLRSLRFLLTMRDSNLFRPANWPRSRLIHPTWHSFPSLTHYYYLLELKAR